MIEKLVSLPMYDWPEQQSDNDRFYSLLKQSFDDHGFSAPDKLDRIQALDSLWLNEELLLSQTCGLPFVTALNDQVSLIGTPAYDIDCDAGQYFSVIVVHKNSAAKNLQDLKGKRFAYNGKGSQSGYAALLDTLIASGLKKEDFADPLQSGSHRDSIKVVANGAADFAAIDAVSWALAKRHDDHAKSLRVIETTRPTPGLPFITAPGMLHQRHILLKVVEEAISSMSQDLQESLLLTGFIRTSKSDYEVITDRLRIIKQNFN